MHTGYNTHGGEGCEQGRASIAEEWERDADDRRDADAHADIYEGLERHKCSNAEAYQSTHRVAGLNADDHAADDNRCEQQNDDDARDHAKFLADNAVNEVRVLAGEIVGLALRAVV